AGARSALFAGSAVTIGAAASVAIAGGAIAAAAGTAVGGAAVMSLEGGVARGRRNATSKRRSPNAIEAHAIARTAREGLRTGMDATNAAPALGMDEVFAVANRDGGVPLGVGSSRMFGNDGSLRPISPDWISRMRR